MFNNVKLYVEDANGQLAEVLLDTKLRNGIYKVSWNVKNHIPGIYYCKLICNETLQVKDDGCKMAKTLLTNQ
jgi:hypothetical protein